MLKYGALMVIALAIGQLSFAPVQNLYHWCKWRYAQLHRL